MVVFKCKMCGGDLEVNKALTVGTCTYCGSTMTLPKEASDQVINLFNRANHFRRNNEFDKAAGVYESILNQDNTNAEAFWGLVLCKYGVEYVEDPKTNKRIPTCHRTQFGSIFTDEDYKEAIKNADPAAIIIYETEAGTIDSIQKQVLEISAREAPFDVFICYKEADENGKRTVDSVLAQDIYYQLINEGFKVFFSRITLEDKIGSAYEPYIFSALHSSKVMVVVGTKPEYINAVWVKNEWSRFLAMIKKGGKKVLIPAYRDMDPYDLPDDFSHLQALDMSKLGFIQDLLRGIRKIVSEPSEKPQIIEKQTITTASANPEPLLERAFLFLEDRNFAKADELLEQVLNLDPRNPRAYVGKLMVELGIGREGELIKSNNVLTSYDNFHKAVRFADTEYKRILEGYNQEIINRKKAFVYQRALQYKEKKTEEFLNFEESLLKAVKLFESIVDFKDSRELASICKELAFTERKRKQRLLRRIILFATTFVGVTGILGAVIWYLIIPLYHYQRAVGLAAQGNLQEAEAAFIQSRGFSNAEYQIQQLEDQILQREEQMRLLEEHKMEERRPLTLSYAKRISVKDKNIAILMEDGSVFQFGAKYDEVYEWTGIQSVYVGENYTLGLKTDGSVLTAGSNSNGRLDVLDWQDIVEVATGTYHTVGLKADGTVVTAGRTKDGLLEVMNWENITAISTGVFHTVGLKSDGTVVATGGNTAGQIDVTGWKDIIAISSGKLHTVGLKSDGTVVAVGNNSKGQLDVSEWKDVVAISAGDYFTVGLKADGTMVATGDNSHNQLEVSAWRNIIAIFAAKNFTVALTLYGDVIRTIENDADNVLLLWQFYN